MSARCLLPARFGPRRRFLALALAIFVFAPAPAGFGTRGDPAAAPRPAGPTANELRRVVVGHEVRFEVDHAARHELDAPVRVRLSDRTARGLVVRGFTPEAREREADAGPSPGRVDRETVLAALAAPARTASGHDRPEVKTSIEPSAPRGRTARTAAAGLDIPEASESRRSPDAPAKTDDKAGRDSRAALSATAPSHGLPSGAVAASGRTILVVGDSLSLSLAEALRPALTRSGAPFASLGKVSSGLARPDFFDWEAQLDRLTREHRPGLVVIMIGANDNKPLRLASGKSAAFGRPGWDEEYARRVARLIAIARRDAPLARVLWVGAPVMADPVLASELRHVNATAAAEVRRHPDCLYLDTWDILSDGRGGYAGTLYGSSGPLRVRAADGVHLMPAGSRLLAEAALRAMSRFPGREVAELAATE